MSKKNKRRKELLQFIRRRSGRRFLISILAKEFMTSERTIQADLRFLEMYGQKQAQNYACFREENGYPVCLKL